MFVGKHDVTVIVDFYGDSFHLQVLEIKRGTRVKYINVYCSKIKS